MKEVTANSVMPHIEGAFALFDLDALADENPPRIRARFDLDDLETPIVVTGEFHAETQSAVFALNLTPKISAELLVDVMEYITTVNAEIYYGNFDIDLPSRAMRFRTAVSFRGSEPTAGLCEAALAYAITGFLKYLGGLLMVIDGEASAQGAFREMQSKSM